MIVGVFTTCHAQYTWDRGMCFFLFNRTKLKFLLHSLHVLYMCFLGDSTGLFEMIVGVFKTCDTQYTWDRSMCVFYLTEQNSKFLLHSLQVLYMCILGDSTWLFEMIVGVFKTYDTQYNWDKSVCVFYLIEQNSKVLLHSLQVLCMWILGDSTGLFEMIVGVLTCHTQYTWDACWCL